MSDERVISAMQEMPDEPAEPSFEIEGGRASATSVFLCG
jgi:hypothetical protein